MGNALDRIKDYIGWWLLIPAFVFVISGVPGCIEQQEQANLKQVQVMTAHCEKQGKTYLSHPNNSSAGQCI